ncbi:MAG TPA: ATP-binding protein [Acidimicrobiales bacterium]|nr:ATP-binding protein [Acidimicrobiales bacterium]
MRYAPAGTTVRVTARRDAQGSRREVAVLDDGPGFPAAFLPGATEAFSRPDSARDRAHGGAGLGLAIVAALVEAHGGELTLANSAPYGAAARLRFPDATEPRTAPRALPAPTAGQDVTVTEAGRPRARNGVD